jgi:hypothetical protein
VDRAALRRDVDEHLLLLIPSRRGDADHTEQVLEGFRLLERKTLV